MLLFLTALQLTLATAAPTDATLQKPRGVAVADGRLFVADTEHGRILVAQLDADGKPGGWIDEWRGFGQPYGLAVDPKGRLVVADLQQQRVTGYTLESKPVWTVPLPSPRGIAAGEDGRLVIAAQPTPDRPNGLWRLVPLGDGYRIDAGDPLPAAAKLTGPWGIVFAPGGLVVSDTQGKATVGACIADGLGLPTGLCRAGDDVLLLESQQHRLLRWSESKWQPLAASGLEQGLQYPQAVCWSDGCLYLADTGNHRVVWGNYQPGGAEVGFTTALAPELPEGTRVVVALGDSITRGVHLAEPETYPSQLQALLREQLGTDKLVVVNTGVGGETVEGGLRRLQADVLRHHPAYVLIGYGMNDSAMSAKDHPKVPLDRYRAGLTSLGEQLKQAGAEPVYATLTPILTEYYDERHPPEWYGEGGAPALLRKYSEVVREVAKSLGAPVVELGGLPAENLRNEANSHTRDGVHLTPAGCGWVAAQYAKLLAPRLR